MSHRYRDLMRSLVDGIEQRALCIEGECAQLRDEDDTRFREVAEAAAQRVRNQDDNQR